MTSTTSPTAVLRRLGAPAAADSFTKSGMLSRKRVSTIPGLTALMLTADSAYSLARARTMPNCAYLTIVYMDMNLGGTPWVTAERRNTIWALGILDIAGRNVFSSNTAERT